MLRLRSAILVVLLALMTWILTIYRSAGPDTASVQRQLGRQLAELGLPAVGSLVITHASYTYRRRVRELRASRENHELLVKTREKMAECEWDLAHTFLARGNLDRATYHFARARDGAPEAETTSRCWEAYIDGLREEPGARSRLLDIHVDEPDNPLPTYLVGLLFVDEGKTREALGYLQRSLKARGGDTHDTRMALAQAFEALGDREAATEHAQAARRTADTPGEKHEAAVLLGQVGASHGSPAMVWLGAFIPRHGSGLIGMLFVMLILVYPTLLGWGGRLAPLVAAWLYLLARSSEPSAVQAYEVALRRWPNNIRLLKALARAYCRVGIGASRAAELYERLWLLRPDDREALSEAARLALECGRDNEEAIQACQTWFEAEPEHPQALAVASHLARACRKRGVSAPVAALPALQLAVEIAPTDCDLRRYLGAMYCHYGLHEEAADTLEPLLSADPNDTESRKEYAHALIGLGDAYAAYRQLCALPPSAEVTTDLYLAGMVAQRKGRYQESLRILEEVVRRDPNLFDARERIAAAAARTDDSRCGPMQVQETVAVHDAAVLYRALHVEHGQVLLLKMRRDFSDGVDFPGLFGSRMEQLKALSGGVAEVLEYGSDEEAYYVVYRMPDGAPLSETIEKGAPLTSERAEAAMTTLLRALQALHGGGEVHGDLRPSAVWVTNDGQGVVVGAGIAQIVDAAARVGPPGARSPFYVAPEVVQDGSVSASADIYSAGCILYEMLVGAPPFGGPTHLATMMAHVTVEPEPPSMRVPGIPRAMDDLTSRALAKDPEERFATAGEFLEAIRSPVSVAAGETEEEGLAAAPPDPRGSPRDGTRAEPMAAQATATSTVTVPPDPNRWWTFYQGTSLIATARFANVYRGVHRQTGETHAIKHLQIARPPALGGVESTSTDGHAARRLFLTEIHILQALSEEAEPIPGLVRMVQAYRADEKNLAYAMPFLTKTLAQRTESTGPIPARAALATAVAVADALAALHGREIVHRNVSATSVMFGDNDEVRLGGFDRACRLSDRGPMLLIERELHSGAASPLHVFGDVRFLSPEQCRGEDFDERADIYSLGCLLHFMLAGEAPFNRTDPMQIMMDHVSSEAPRLRDIGVAVPGEIQSVIDRALAKSPEDRYAGITDMREAIALQMR